MKIKSLYVWGLVALFGGVASADTLCSAGGQNSPDSIAGHVVTGTLTQSGSLTSSFSCSIGGFTFSNFSVFGTVVNEGGGISGFTLTESSSGNTIDFGFPNLSGANDDIGLQFQITPGVLGETLGAGPGTTVTELICSVPAGTSGTCSGTVLSLNGSWMASNGGSSFSNITGASVDYVFKDIRGGSSVSQTLVPEPMTFSLLGVGLLGVGLAGRRLRRS